MNNIEENEIFEVHHEEMPFVMINNALIQCDYLSWSAKGLLCYLLSLPKNWKIHTWHLADVYAGEKNGNKIDGIRTIFKELKEQGHLLYEKTRNEKGQWIHKYKIFSKRQDFQKMFPHGEVPNLDVPGLESPHIKQKTEYRKTEIKKELLPDRSKVKSESPKKEAPSGVVVSLDQLELTPSCIRALIAKYTKEELDLAVKRVLQWKTREDDAKAIYTVLKNKDTWIDQEPFEKIMQKNNEFLKKLQQQKGLDESKIGNTTVHIGYNYVEFVCGPFLSRYEVKMKTFIEDVKKYFKKLKDSSL